VLLPNGATTVPWTYLEVVEHAAASGAGEQDDLVPDGDGVSVLARIRSATQQPLSARRGRTEQVAIGIRAERGESTIRLQSRVKPDKPLVGYEVFAQNVDEKPMRPLGRSDEAGEVTVTAGKSAVQMLFVKSDGVFLARLPIVPGAEPDLRVPLPDDDVRLRVAARLASFREDMVDLVARRNIFMARVRQEIEEKNFDRARELLESLDELPGATQFNLMLDREAEVHRADDQQVQTRIDRLIAQTRTALGKFFDPKPISELHEELRRAEGLDRQANSKSAEDAS
jgi:hypothetical protein